MMEEVNWEDKKVKELLTEDISLPEVSEVSEESLPEVSEKVDIINNLRKELKEKDELIAEQEERIKRAVADFENYRRRSEERFEEFVQYASKNLILEILPVIDNFERALKIAREAEDFNSMIDGMSMILTQLKEILHKEGVEPIEALNKRFDPQLHDAVMCEQNDCYPEDTVVEELRRGYKYKSQVIRPAMVKVARSGQ